MNSKYLCPYCTAAFDAHEALKAHVVADHAAEPLPRPVGAITITVNGQRYEHSVEPNVTLYTLIHDRMGLTGAKMFCDRGACGSCTVIMDGRPILSCMTLAIECDGKTIETVEGIAAPTIPSSKPTSSTTACSAATARPASWSPQRRCSTKTPTPRKRRYGRPSQATSAGAGPIPSTPRR